MSSSIERLVDRQVMLWHLRQRALVSSTSAGVATRAQAAKLAVQEPAPQAPEPAPISGVRHRLPAYVSEQVPVKRALLR